MRPRACFPAAEALALAMLAGPAAGCPAVGATYAPALDEPGEGARITLVAPSRDEAMANAGLDLVLAVPGRTPFAFGTFETLGYGSRMAFPRPGNPVHDPEARPEFPLAAFGAGDGGQLVPAGLPLPGEPAPEALFVAGMGAALWYGTNGSDAPIVLTEALWYRSGCGPG